MDLNLVLDNLKKNKKLEPYINYIRFPFYRNLETDLRIDFDFPLTAIVGQNGTNKSSLLRAIYGCPEDYNVGNFWFSTALDPILENEGRPRFIYSYFQPDAKKEVEVIKTRIQRSYKKNGKKTRVNPDYWEPSRPIISDKMEPMPEDDGFLKGRKKTRWNLIKKDVIFMDFRSEISAFDRYFYHGDLKKTLRHHTKQDYIRNKSQLIREAIEKNLKSKKMYRGSKEQILNNDILPREQVEIISDILGRNYSEIRIIEHRFFARIGESVILSSQNFQYSEAFAGSGEFAVVMLVNKICDAKDSSLIILDEPEVSLHPGAQDRLVDFLKQRIKKNKHQIVIGTHSPFIIRTLPKSAVKTLFTDPITGKIQATNETLSEEAFFHLGVRTQRKTIFVEDRLATEIVKKALKIKGQAVFDSFDIKFMAGGASVLLSHYLPAYATTNRLDCLFLLDGDQRPDTERAFDCSLEALDTEQIDREVQRLLHSSPDYKVDGGSGGPREDQLIDQKLKTIKFCDKYLEYLPSENPEAFIWDKGGCALPQVDVSELSYKERFERLTRLELDLAEFETLSGEDIFHVQKRYLAKVPSIELEEVANKAVHFLSESGE